MDEQPPHYHREFLGSPQHAVLGALTLGVGFMTGAVLPLVAGATCYALGWIYLPDLPFFRRWVDRRRDAVKRAEEQQKIAEFAQRRDALIASLSPDRRVRYNRLAQVCRDIENASHDNPLASADPATDPRLRKLDELMWTFLRLLGIEQSLGQFLENENRENIPTVLKEAEAEATQLTTELDALKAKGADPSIDSKQRYLGSRLDRLEVLRKRQHRIQQAQENLDLIESEQDRLEQQIKLLRADAVATKNADALTARIDATVEHLDQTNKWLSELDEFKDLVGDMPSTEQRVGYEAKEPARPGTVPTPPPIIRPVPFKKSYTPGQKQTG
jgi:hypothetical protein